MGLFAKIFKGGLKDTIDSIGNTIDKMTTTDEERNAAKTEIINKVSDFVETITAQQAEVLKVELQGNWLQRSWRPLIMLAFGFIVCYRYFLAPTFSLPMAELPEHFWGLLEVGMGGYVIGRSVEKVADSITTNLDKIPRKNKS